MARHLFELALFSSTVLAGFSPRSSRHQTGLLSRWSAPHSRKVGWMLYINLHDVSFFILLSRRLIYRFIDRFICVHVNEGINTHISCFLIYSFFKCTFLGSKPTCLCHAWVFLHTRDFCSNNNKSVKKTHQPRSQLIYPDQRGRLCVFFKFAWEMSF